MNNTEIFTTEETLTEHAYSPKLPLALSKVLNPNLPVLDFGCGDGSYLRDLSTLKSYPSLIGVEGTKNLSLVQKFPNIVQWDLRNPLWLGVKGSVLSFEVAEHIHEEYHENYLDTLVRHSIDTLCISWAVRGQGGCRHVAERNWDEVIPLFSSYGFKYDNEKSLFLRIEAGQDLPWFKDTIYFFEK